MFGTPNDDIDHDLDTELERLTLMNAAMDMMLEIDRFYIISFQTKEDEVQPKFSDFFKLSHQSKKKEGSWIDQRIEDEYLKLKQLENNSSINGEEFISPEE